MTDIFSKLGKEDILPMVIVAIIFGTVGLVALLSIVASCIYKVRQLSVSTRMKQEMLDRGMSADEIKTVLEAGQRK
jgi:hypothetical protein